MADITVPVLGESVTEATVGSWKKAAGDQGPSSAAVTSRSARAATPESRRWRRPLRPRCARVGRKSSEAERLVRGSSRPTEASSPAAPTTQTPLAQIPARTP